MDKHVLAIPAMTLLALLLLLFTACGGPAPPQGKEPTAAPTEIIQQQEEEEPTVQPASGDGEALLQERCTVCHSLGQVEQAQRSREEWEQNIARMVGKGAELDENEQVILIEYLAETYGP